MVLLKIIYSANVLVAAWVGLSSLFFPSIATQTVFTGAYPPSQYIRLVGCLWLGIAFLSVLGLFRPVTFSPVLILQLFYKAIWLLVVALPAIMRHQQYPKAMAVFFLVWVLVIPVAIPYKELFAS